jgi:excisionase family DNA binding protein
MEEILTVREVAAYLKVSRTTVWRWCNEGTLPAVKIGRGWRVRQRDLERFVGVNREIGPRAGSDNLASVLS